MTEQIPFDPGGPGSLIDANAEADKPEPPLKQPISESIQHGVCFEASDATRYRANTHPPAIAQHFEHAQYPQVSSASGQIVGPPSQASYSLQTASYSQQAYNLHQTPPYSAHIYGSFGNQHSRADRRNSLPLRYHPYSGHAPLVLQGHSPVRGDFGHHDALLYRTRAGAPYLRDSHAEKRKENDPRQTSHGQVLPIDTAPSVSGSKVRSLHPAKAFEILRASPQAQEVLPTLKSPTTKVPPAPSAYAGPKIPSSTLSARTPSSPLEGLHQARMIVSLAKPNAVIRESVREVFNDEQCDKILWLALHGVPSGAIAHLLTIGSEPVQPPSGRLDKKGFVAILSSIVQYFVPELAAPQDGEESPEALVRRLLDRGDSLFWSPFLLKHAIDYTFISDDNGSSADQERMRNARERRAVPKWRANGENPADTVLLPTGRKRRNSTKIMVAMGGVMREASEQEIIEEHFGYRDGSREVEEVLMKKWLLKIRELGRLPDRSEVAQVQMEDGGFEATTAT